MEIPHKGIYSKKCNTLIPAERKGTYKETSPHAGPAIVHFNTSKYSVGHS